MPGKEIMPGGFGGPLSPISQTTAGAILAAALREKQDMEGSPFDEKQMRQAAERKVSELQSLLDASRKREEALHLELAALKRTYGEL